MKTNVLPLPCVDNPPVAMPGRRRFGKSLAAMSFAPVLAGAWPATAFAQTYPDRLIRIVAPFSPGGALDLIARGVAQALQTQMGQSVLVDNRPGAAGIIGSQSVMKAAANGHMLLLGSTKTHGINPVLYKTPTYDPSKDFESVSLLATIPHVLIVAPNFPANNLQEFIRHARPIQGWRSVQPA